MQLLHKEMLVYFHYTILLPNKVGGPLKTHKRKEIIMAIIDSVRKLAEKVGADTNGRDIADQLNIINKHLDNTQPGSRDIAEAVSKFADKEDGTAILTTKTITENKTYKASDDGASGYSSVTVNVSGTGFQLMSCSIRGQEEDLRYSDVYINNDSATVDLTTIFSTNSSHNVYIINPVDELRVTSLESAGNGYTIYFVPTQNCKVYEHSTELDLNDIFQSEQTPAGPTVYEPNGVRVHKLEASYSPYDGKVRKLYDKGGSMYLTIE
jgi:hypothetical protein